MQIFAYTENPDLKALLEMECRDSFGVRPVVHNVVEDLKYVLTIFESIDLLIVDMPVDEVRSRRLAEILIAARIRIKKVFICGDEKIANFHFFNRPDIAVMFEEIRKLSTSDSVSSGEWMAIPITSLVHFQSLPFDLYIRLSEQRFVKRVPAFEIVGPEMMESLSQKGIGELYFQKKYKRDFSMMLINNMINKVERTYSSYKLQLRAQDEVLQTTKEIILNLGISGRVIEVCEAAVDRMLKDIMKNKDDMSEFLKSLSTDPDLKFHFKLISLTNYIASQLITEMGLPDPAGQIRKIVFASYFCDMTLKREELLHLRNANAGCRLTLHDQNEVNFHALKASELVAGNKEISAEIAIIIKQHHGSFSGIGFPQEKSNQLHPLSKILIVSQELAYAILTDRDVPSMESLKESFRKLTSESLLELVLDLESIFRVKPEAMA